jgi:serine/threonine protein kinase
VKKGRPQGNAMSTDPVTSFIEELRGSQILEADQLEEVQRLRREAKQPAQLAGELIKRGWLTTHQANQVARGRGSELALGSYLIQAPLGHGGMGQVVKARHRFLKRDVALKLIRQDRQEIAETVQRFEREVRLLAKLRHPHIVQAHDAGRIGDVWFLAMELLEGCDLEQLVRQRGPLPVGEACSYVRQAALALHYAHQHGLVHRDVKPSNLFLTEDGIKVLDLGLARSQKMEAAGELTRANTVMGTPDYLAPEQALDPRQADARTDLYGLGCTIYFLLTGAPPFPEGTLAQKLLNHQQCDPPAIGRRRRDVPPAVAALLHRMLAKKPGDRPANALEVAVQLEPFTASGTGAGAAVKASPQPRVGGRPASSGPGSSSVLSGETIAPPADAAARPMPRISPPASRPSAATEYVDAPAVSRTVLAAVLVKLPSWWPWAAVAAGGVAAVGLCLLVLVLFIIAFGPRGDSQTDKTPAKSTDQQIAAKGANDKQTVNNDKKGSGEKQPADIKRKAPLKVDEPAGPKTDPPELLLALGPQEQADPASPPFVFDPELLKQPSGSKVFLSDLQEFAQKGNLPDWPFSKNGRQAGNDNPLIKVNGKHYLKGLSTHPPFGGFIRVCYALGKKARSLHGAVALADYSGFWQPKPTRFVILADGRVRWRSSIINQRGVTEAFDLDVHDVDVLELRAYIDRNLNAGAHAVWLDPFVIAGQGKPTYFTPKEHNKPGPKAAGNGFSLGSAKVVGVRASGQTPDAFGSQPEKAFDGDLKTQWNSGTWPPAWIEADLGKPTKLKAIRLNTGQRPDGRTIHEVWISIKPIGNDYHGAVKIHTFDGFTRDKDTLRYSFPSGTTAHYIQIKTTRSPSWVTWYEIAIDHVDG